MNDEFAGEPDTTEGAALADIAQRTLARMIDTGLVVFVWLLILGVFYTDERKLATAMISVGFLVFYETWSVARHGTTIGKSIMSIAVVMRSTGERPPWVNAFLRVTPAIPIVVVSGQFFIFLLPLLYSIAGFTADRRGPVDWLAGTVVVKQPD